MKITQKKLPLILSLGSNQGDRKKKLDEAILHIEKSIGLIEKTSSIYKTEPWGIKNQASFLNQVIVTSSSLAPSDLLSIILQIEKKMGRVRIQKWGPRTIDIDIIAYGNLSVDTEKIIIPHAQMHLRSFILTPLNEIVPDWIHPTLSLSIIELLNSCTDNSKVEKIQCPI